MDKSNNENPLEELLEAIILDNDNGLFKIQTANEWMDQSKLKPIPKMLFSELWFESELCILFADTNLGKSILAVQIGNSISKGESIKGFKLEGSKQPILYFDFELSDKQFENRYSTDYKNHYTFDENFLRIEIDSEADIPKNETFEDYLYKSLEKSIITTGAKILIIDNITYLKTETEKAKDALPLMKELKALKSKYSLSILALAHTPKRDLSKPITRNDLQGSKMLINFCDSSFSIGESSSNSGLRYIKQIKQRNTEDIYNADNVPMFEIDKTDSFLQFEFVRFGTEQENLKQFTPKEKGEQDAKILDLHEQGKSYRAIGVELGINHMKVQRLIAKNQL